MNRKIWLSSPHMGGREKDFVNEAFDANWIAPLGPNVNGFEKDLETYLGGGMHVAALSSGTAALHLALILLGIKPGDEVICQSLTFSASANPIVYQGATPVFVDSEEDTWNMSPEWLETAIRDRIRKGKKPRAIIVVHLYGTPAKMKEIQAIATRYEIPLVEDAAEGLGARYKAPNAGEAAWQPLGTLGELSVLSFNGNKIITTSGGGALAARDEALVAKARFLATQARDPAPHYQHSEIGYNYRMSNICAGIGRGQMLVLDERVRQRRRNFDFYREALSGIPGFSLPPEPPFAFSNRWLTTVLVDPSAAGIGKDDIRLGLEKENIESRPIWKPMHLQPVFRDCAYFGAQVAEHIFDRGLCLPSGSNLRQADLTRVLDEILQLVKRL